MGLCRVAGGGTVGGQRHRLSWAAAACFGGLAIGRLAGVDQFRAVGAPAAALLPFTPHAAAAAWIAALLARDRRARAINAFAAVTMTATLVPRTMARPQPLATGPTLRVLTANLFVGRAAADPLVELAGRTEADVLFVQELGEDAAIRLARAGLGDQFPYLISDVGTEAERGNGIYAKYPLRMCGPVLPTSSVQPIVTLAFPSMPVWLVSVHTWTPKRPCTRPGVSLWRDDLAVLAELPVPAGPADPPVIVAGDFNSTLDHAGFRRLLRDPGGRPPESPRRGRLVDAARETGQGLVPTWSPAPWCPLPLLAIDHILVDRRCAVLDTSVHRLPGTDHRAVFAQVRLPCLPGGTTPRNPPNAGAP
ncbi:MAG TPA: endonuclease/exonuclease/phosphatase family protein [Streptosporangiaceae bacterium]|nr:endonuclease/exonuclease/phosphatase family protein [Streptosporangiaceae bacterium]